jgi:hypothetical protein
MRAAFQLYPTEAIGYRRLLYADPPKKTAVRENVRRELPCTLPCTGMIRLRARDPVYSSRALRLT